MRLSVLICIFALIMIRGRFAPSTSASAVMAYSRPRCGNVHSSHIMPSYHWIYPNEGEIAPSQRVMAGGTEDTSNCSTDHVYSADEVYVLLASVDTRL